MGDLWLAFTPASACRRWRWLALAAVVLLLCAAAAGQQPVTIFLAGDSTMAEKLPEKRPETGWGECLQRYFDAGKVRVENHAKNGRSTRTFIGEGLWAGILQKLRPGDYVFIQFGHNDSSKEKVDRYTTAEEYRRNLARFVADVREKSASPVLLTPVVRRRFDEAGGFYDTHGEYPELVRGVAAELKVPLIDMQRKSEQVLRQHGAERSKELFLWLAPNAHPNYPQGLQDNTHFNPAGAQLMAGLAVEGICEAQLPLARNITATEARPAACK